MHLREHRPWFGLSRAALLAALLAAGLPLVASAVFGAGPSASANGAPLKTDAEGVNWRVFQNTGVLCAGVVLIALPAGTLLAVLLARTDVPGKRLATAALAFLLFLPLYMQVAGWEAAFGKLGWLTSITGRPLLVGMRAVIFIHAMAAIPWSALIVWLGLPLVRRVEEEAALLDASGPRVLANVVLPQLAPFLGAAALLTAVSAAGEMTVTNIYLVAPGDYTLAEHLYMTLQSQPPAEAVARSLPSIAASALLIAGSLLALVRLAVVSERFTEDRYEPLIYRLGHWKSPVALGLWLFLALLVVTPLVSMACKAGMLVTADSGAPLRTWSALKCVTLPGIALARSREELGCTVAIGAAAATLALVTALGLAQGARRARGGPWLAVAIAAAAWAIPGPIVGLGLIALLNHDVAGLAWLYDRTDVAAILAQTVKAAPLVVLAVWHAISRFPSGPLEAAQIDGAGEWTIFWRIILPQRLAALATAWLVGFAIASGDLAWSILVLRPGIDTLPRLLFGFVHSGADDQVAGISLAMSVLYGAVTVVLLMLMRRSRGALSGRAAGSPP